MDKLAAAALEGRPLDGMTVIDSHMHSTRVSHFFSRYDGGDDLLAQMDLIGVDRGILSDLWSTGEDWDSFPKLSAFCARAPGRFYAYASPHPAWQNFEAALESQAASPLVVGIKLHPDLHQKPFGCPRYRFAYELGARAGLPVLLHTWGTGDIQTVAALAAEYPKTCFLLGHSGGEEDAVALAAQLAAVQDNLYLDTACSYVWQGALEHMVRTAGADKVLFGSDAYWNSMEAAIGRILFADLYEAEKRQVLGLNAKGFFRWADGDVPV